MMRFPDGFLWGVATSAYQIEGAVRADGRGESIWDRFAHTPGNTVNGDTGDVACDHYHRFAEDVALMADLGYKAYRFSIAWPRIQPTGRGPANPKGLDFYRRLVDCLLERGITPMVTLYHWDLPQALQEEGGWLNRDTAERFGDFASLMFEALGDRVQLWLTHNEPWCASMLGHFRGVHAPGLRDLRAGVISSHHILLSHGRAVAAFRSGGYRGQIGIAPNLLPNYPLTDSTADREATRISDGYVNRWFLDPVLNDRYPADMLEFYGRVVGPLDFIREDDLAAMGAPVDFLGINYYRRRTIEADPTSELGFKVHDIVPGTPTTVTGSEIVPECLYDLLLWVKAHYGDVPLYITENGMVRDDQIGPDGQVHDPERIDFLRRHVAAAYRAIEAGVNLRGFFAWSFMDNFEWAFGYSQRFGLVYVDYATQRRIPKDSARWWGEVARRNGLDDADAALAEQPLVAGHSGAAPDRPMFTEREG
ncbi:MAG: GH1 family beta-glucosidase [Symbiobacterium sp.]|uniref:GH1 family beta-glucosidase n=1 Tax=Symbiobacterium sp. TaxID=1971213 RepID=UPI0034641D24